MFIRVTCCQGILSTSFTDPESAMIYFFLNASQRVPLIKTR